MSRITLGEDALYPEHYDASLLQPIARARARTGLPHEALFVGRDVWTAYELSWLLPGGKPVAAIAEFEFDALSPAIIESKSFKYYLNSFNQTEFAGERAVVETLSRDLSAASGAPVVVRCFDIDQYPAQIGALPGSCVDALPLLTNSYQPDAGLLEFGSGRQQRQSLYSHLLKSNCPVTGQPDWASLWICYSGSALVPESFLRYVVSFRHHQGFHESCVERIFCDLMASGQIDSLAVYARYTRRGGLDINPFRASSDWAAGLPASLAELRIARQ